MKKKTKSLMSIITASLLPALVSAQVDHAALTPDVYYNADDDQVEITAYIINRNFTVSRPSGRFNIRFLLSTSDDINDADAIIGDDDNGISRIITGDQNNVPGFISSSKVEHGTYWVFTCVEDDLDVNSSNDCSDGVQVAVEKPFYNLSKVSLTRDEMSIKVSAELNNIGAVALNDESIHVVGILYKSEEEPSEGRIRSRGDRKFSRDIEFSDNSQESLLKETLVLPKEFGRYWLLLQTDHATHIESIVIDGSCIGEYLDLPFSKLDNGFVVTRGQNAGKHSIGDNYDNVFAIDINLDHNELLAPFDGKVIGKENNRGSGLTLIIQSDDLKNTWVLLHMSRIDVEEGAIQRGQLLGISGNTGKNSSGSHLHFHQWNKKFDGKGSYDSHTIQFSAPLRVGIKDSSGVLRERCLHADELKDANVNGDVWYSFLEKQPVLSENTGGGGSDSEVNLNQNESNSGSGGIQLFEISFLILIGFSRKIGVLLKM